MKKVFYSVFRIFIIVTGFIPYILFMRPKFFYASAKAKKDFKKQRNGVLYISNHTKVLDYYGFVFKKAFRYVHTMVAEVVYKGGFMKLLTEVMGNIKIDRVAGQNASPIKQALDYLNNGKIVLIFPEGKLEKTPGILENFTDSFAFLSLKSGKPIIPFYIDGRYGLFKRPTFVVGEAITPKNVENDNVSQEQIDEYVKLVERKIKKLKTICRDHKSVRTKKIFTRRYWLMDFTKITSIPIFYFVFPTRKYYLGNKKKIKQALKYNALICPNHCGPCDAMYMFMHFFSRRVRIVTAEEVYWTKFLQFVLTNSGMIKYNRAQKESVDLSAFKDSIATLNGRGVVCVFPEGHISFDGKFDENIKAGASAMSLMTNSPIIPFIFVNPYKYFKYNKVVYGEPLYPADYIDDLENINAEKIDKFNNVIKEKMKAIYEIAVTKRSKNFEKTFYYKSND